MIVGRPDLGAPDWRNNVPGTPMSAQDVSDVVAWLASQRTKFPGQPYPTIRNRQEKFDDFSTVQQARRSHEAGNLP